MSQEIDIQKVMNPNQSYGIKESWTNKQKEREKDLFFSSLDRKKLPIMKKNMATSLNFYQPVKVKTYRVSTESQLFDSNYDLKYWKNSHLHDDGKSFIKLSQIIRKLFKYSESRS